MDKNELLVEIKTKPTAVIIKEFTKTGAKIQYNLVGEVNGKYSGSHMETAGVFQKMDGSNEWEARAIETTKDGGTIMIAAKGTRRQGTFQGEGTCMTMSPKLSWLNNLRARVKGVTDLKDGSSIMKVYAMK